jgi:non-structural maintenance of chromosomes element 4
VDEAARPGSTTLQELTNLSNHFYQHVRAPTEAAMDADVQVGLARMGLTKSNNLNQGMRRYEAKEFIARLRDYAQTDAGHLDWLNLGKSARFYYRRSAGLSTMYGPITVEMKERKATQRQARDVIEKAIAPDVITNTQTDQSANETSKRVNMIVKALAALHQQRRAAGQDIEFFEFVVNPHSFTQTVENIFHLSFGVKRGFAKIVKARDGRLLVEPSSANAPADAAGADDGGGAQSHQAVVTMSIALWRHIVQELGLTEPLIDPRASVTTAEYLPESVRQDVPDEAASKKRQRTQQSQSRSKRRTQAAAADDDDEEVDELADDDNDDNDKDPPKAAKKPAPTTEDDDDADDAAPKRKKRMPAKKVAKRIADDDDDEAE